MNSQVKLFLTGIVAFAAGGLLVYYLVRQPPKAGGESSSAGEAREKRGANGGMILTLDAETQRRIGLKIEAPVPAQWQPEVKGYGRVIDPAALSAAVADLESARTAAEASNQEYARLKILAEQNNASARALEAARAAATRDTLGFESIRAKFALDWGKWPEERTNPGTFVQQLSNGEATLVRIDLPPGQTLSSPPASARMVALTDEAKSVNGELFSATTGVNSQTQSQSFFFLVKDQPLTSGAAVTGYLRVAGERVTGAVVPSDAVLRYEGKGWIYVQTGTNNFVRAEIPLDRPAENGWFVSGGLTATNRVVVSGAQTVLSAELSGGNFNIGGRD